SSRRRHTRSKRDWSSDVCSSDLEGVFLGPSCVFTNVINPRSLIEKKDEYKKTVLKKGASIGANSTIVCGNTIGKFSLVGAGAVRSEERRVGKECRYRRAREQSKE